MSIETTIDKMKPGQYIGIIQERTNVKTLKGAPAISKVNRFVCKVGTPASYEDRVKKNNPDFVSQGLPAHQSWKAGQEGKVILMSGKEYLRIYPEHNPSVKVTWKLGGKVVEYKAVEPYLYSSEKPTTKELARSRSAIRQGVDVTAVVVPLTLGVDSIKKIRYGGKK